MEITQKHVTENIFSQYMYKTLPSSSHLWTFKRQLSQQLAISKLSLGALAHRRTHADEDHVREEHG